MRGTMVTERGTMVIGLRTKFFLDRSLWYPHYAIRQTYAHMMNSAILDFF